MSHTNPVATPAPRHLPSLSPPLSPPPPLTLPPAPRHLPSLPPQDMDNIASDVHPQDLAHRGLRAATKSMFKARVVGDFSRGPARRAAAPLSSLQQQQPQQHAASGTGPALHETSSQTSLLLHVGGAAP